MTENIQPNVLETRRRTLLLGDQPKTIKPLDYESVVDQRKAQMDRDPHRALLLCPEDDLMKSHIPRQMTTMVPSEPQNAEQEVQSLFSKECIKTYNTSGYNIIDYKYKAYSGGFCMLPSNKDLKTRKLSAHVFGIDEDEEDEDSTSQRGGIVKQGWLQKVVHTCMTPSLVPLMRTERRFFQLNSSILNSYEDQHCKDIKGSTCLESCIDVLLYPKISNGVQLRMKKHCDVFLSADSEAEMKEWMVALKQTLERSSAPPQDRRRQEESRTAPPQDRRRQEESRTAPPQDRRDGGGSQDHSVPLFMHYRQYAWEKDQLNEGRLNMLCLDPETQRQDCSGMEANVESFRQDCSGMEAEVKSFSQRILVSCHDLTFNLQGCVSEKGDGIPTNVEPFFISLALFDVSKSRKISADFHVDLNPPCVRDMLTHASSGLLSSSSSSSSHLEGGGGDGGGASGRGVAAHGDGLPVLQHVSESLLRFPTKGIFSVTNPHSDIFLVARVEKVLQNSITHCAEPYIKTYNINKTTQEVLKVAKQTCQHLGQYRMPFAWAAKQVFKDPRGTLDVEGKFSPLYRQNSSKISNENIIGLLADISKPDKNKLLTIPGQLNISIECVPSDISNTVTSSYIPVRPLEEGCEKVSVEIEEFLPEEAKYHVPFTTYQNHLYIYPLQLKDIKQKAFTKAKNIAVCIQLRDSDEEGSSPLKCIYGKPGETLFTSSAYAAVLHNKQSPEFYEEIKMELPVHVHQKHHVLFSFYHINCEVNGKDNVKDRESLVGFSWVPLLTKGRMQSVNVQLPVSTTLPPGYLGDMSVESQKSQPDIKWVENAIPLFKVKTHVASTIYTQDQHLHNFFEHCQLMRTTSDVNTAQLTRVVKALHATENRVIINFLPTVLKQVFEVLAMATKEADDIASDSLHVIVHMVSLCHKEGLERYLRTFLKYEFLTSDPMPESYGRTHQVLARAITAMLEQRHDFIRDTLLKHSWFFFESLAKSMVKYLQEDNRMKMPRAQRFPDSFHQALRSLLLSIIPHINERHQEIPEEARCINMSLATFIKSCLTFMDRGFAFSLINDYLCGITGLKDNQVLSEMKLDFLVSVCNHEHYIPLNLPMVLGCSTLVQEFSLTEDYCSNHFLVGLLLRQVGGALRQGPHVQQGPHIAVLKNLLIKHAMDGRYAADKNQARICLLYLPLLELLYQNLKQLSAQPNMSSPDALPRRGSATGPLLPGKQGQTETRGLLQCFLHIVSTLSKDSLLAYWKQLSPQNISNFLSLLELCQVQFRYTGKKNIGRSQLLTSDRKSQNLPTMPSSMVNLVQARVQQFTLLSLNTGTGPSEAKAHHQALLESNMSTEAYLTVLDVLSLFTDCFKTQLLDSDGHNLLMKKVFDLYLTFLKVSQSEAALGHVFTALKAFIRNFPSVLFTGRVILCETLCYEVLRCCMSNPASLRSEASALLYLLIQTNYEFTERKSFLRTDLQIIIAMIQLISDVTVTDQMCRHVQDSLSIINSLAKSDLSNFTESDKPTAFPVAVEGLTQRICTVLKVSTQMREHEKDPEMLLDLEDGLARSYASTPQLRCTWLDNMAQAHLKNGDMSEAAMCYVHIAALVAEYLHRKKLFPSGVEAFHKITFNIHEEAAMMEDTKEDTGMQDSYYTEEVLVEYLEWCVEALVKAERYELVTHIASLLSPMYDKRHLFKKLRDLHGELQKAYTKVILFMQARGSRLLGTYYRVAFYGKEFKEEDRKQYIYKEPKITTLSEIQNRLLALYGEKFGAENIKILQDSNKVKPEDLEPRFSYIQLTSVQPYFEEEEADTKTDFEKVQNIKRFMFETPYTLVGGKHGGIEDQWKRRTLLTTSHTFPYVKKRMEVVHQEEQELEPLSIAIDEVRKRTSTLTRLCTSGHVDTKMLQLQLSGSVAAKVNPGPVAYARAFLDDSKPTQSTKEAKDLKERFRKFVQVCMVALDTNESLIKEDQLEYHTELMNQFNTMVEELSALIN